MTFPSPTPNTLRMARRRERWLARLSDRFYLKVPPNPLSTRSFARSSTGATRARRPVSSPRCLAGRRLFGPVWRVTPDHDSASFGQVAYRTRTATLGCPSCSRQLRVCNCRAIRNFVLRSRDREWVRGCGSSTLGLPGRTAVEGVTQCPRGNGGVPGGP